MTKQKVKLTLMAFVTLALGMLGILGGCSGGQGNSSSLFSPLRLGSVSPEKLERRVLEVLRQSVNSDRPAVRCHGLESLAALGGLEAPALIRTRLYDSVAAVRFAAAVAAGDIKDHAARNLLEILLRDPDPSVSLAAGYSLEQLGDQRFAGWYDNALNSNDAKLCGQACLLLGKLGDTPLHTDSREKLWEVLRKKGQHDSVRLQAAESLARLDDKAVIKRLIAFAGDKWADHQVIAISGLELIGGPDAFAMLTVLTGTDRVIEVRLAAYRALGPANDQHGLAEVRESIRYRERGPDTLAQNRIRGLAALALGRIGTMQDSGLLYHAMADKAPYVRIAAARGSIDFLERYGQGAAAQGM